MAYQLLIATVKMIQRWWLAYVYAFLFVVHATGTALVASLTGANWSSLTGTQKVVMVSAMTVNVTGVLMAFLSQTISRIKSGQTVIPTGDTTATNNTTKQ